MTDAAFVRALEIARDDRLRGLHAEAAALRLPDRARRGEPAPGAGLPDLADPRHRAAVNGSAVVGFVAGLSAAEKEDVLYSTQLAQRAATARHDRHADTEGWYGAYISVLERLGWSGAGFAFTAREGESGRFTMDKSALEVVAAIATSNQLAILVKSLDILKGLADGDGAIRLWEMQALAETSGNFQLGAVERAGNGALTLALGAFHFRTKEHRKRALFWRWGAEEIAFWAAAQTLTLNTRHYAGLRQAVIEKLAEDAADYIAALAVA